MRRSNKATKSYESSDGMNEKDDRSKQLLRCDSWSDGAKNE